jgi:cyclophilin family peptidyl-prolyl cis-trans isomerase
MKIRILRMALLIVVLRCCLCGAEDPVGNPCSKREVFARVEELYREMVVLKQRMSELRQKYEQETDETIRTGIFEKHESVGEEHDQVAPRLREAVIAAYKVSPNEHELVNKLMLDAIRHDNQLDNDDSAMDLIRLLEAAKCEEPEFYALAGVTAHHLDDYATAGEYLTKGLRAGKLNVEAQKMLGNLSEQKKYWADELEKRKREAAADDLPRVKLETNKGAIVIELFENEAPQTVGNFVSLVESKFYDGLTFHRVLPGFMAQGGDPKGDGTGGPGYQIFCECRDGKDFRRHFRGTLSMAHAGRDTGGSQFFLTFRPQPYLDGRHTVFGRVIDGQDVLMKLQRRDPNDENLPEPDKIVKATVVRKRDHKYEPTKVK